MSTSPNGSGRARSRDRDLLAINLLLARAELARQWYDPERDLDTRCGYYTGPVAAALYQDLYWYDPIARRVVQVWPFESWQCSPTVYEDEDADTVTPFEEAWDALGAGLRGEGSWFEEEHGSLIWHYLRRADELSGIGRFGLLLLGLDDGQDLATEARPRDGQRLLFLRVFPEALVTIKERERDPRSPRFGQPLTYTLKLTDPRQQELGAGLAVSDVDVHWSRVIHLADNRGTSEVYGTPRMEPVRNRLHDLRKLYGGSAEMYWLGAFPGLALETNPQLTLEEASDINPESLREMMGDYQGGLQRWLALVGMTAKSLAPQVVDPTPQIAVQLEALCIQLAMPMRKFKGSERGELSSTQDEGDWSDRVRERQTHYLTPCVIVPFVDRLIALGVLPAPAQGYRVAWPDLAQQSELEQADVAVKQTQALAQYVSAGVETLIPPLDYLTRILGLAEEEATAILESAEDRIEEEDTGGSPLLSTVGGVGAVLEFFKQFKGGVISEETLKQLLMLFYQVDEAKAEAIIAGGLPEQPAAAPAAAPAAPPVPPVAPVPAEGEDDGE
jgi:uncharacterized protein